MTKEKILILAYDGLEISLVDKFNLPNLKQNERGKTNISEFDKIATPILWGSFLTGQNLEPEFTKEKSSNVLQKILVPPYHFLKKNISASRANSAKEFSKKIGLFQKTGGSIHRWNVDKDLGKKTIFDLVDDSIGINIPSYNRSEWPTISPQFTMKEMVEGEVPYSDYWDDVWNCFEKTKAELLNNLDKDLVMAWFKAADSVGHFWRTNTDKMEEAYVTLNDFTAKIKERFDGWILIIADHGMKPLGRFGDHTNLNYGYYSSSHKLGLNNPRLTDFYEIIHDKLYGEFNPEKYSGERISEAGEEEFEGNEEEEIKKRLRGLGYFD